MITRKILSVLLAAVLLGSVTLAGCKSSKSSGTSQSGEVTTVNIFANFSTPEPPAATTDAQLEIEKRTNTKLNIMWTSSNDFQQKENVLLASGNIPDLMQIADSSWDVKVTQFIQMAEQGAFWDLGPYVKNYKNLMEYPKSTWNNVKNNGKQYLIPSIRPLEGASYFALRKDWLDKLNMKMPTTIDELYSDLTAFKKNAGTLLPSGKTGTITPYNSRGWQGVLNTFTGSNGKWKLVNGQIVDADLMPETKDGIGWMRNAYTDGLIPKDFSTLKDSQLSDISWSGYCGMGSDTVEGMYRSTAASQSVDPKADFMAVTYLTGPNGKFAPQNSGYSGAYAIPKTVSEKKMKVILNLMDFGASEEGFDLACYGVKGNDYTTTGDGYVQMNQSAINANIGQSSYGKIFERYDKYLWARRVGMPEEMYKRNKTIIDDRSKVSVAKPTMGLVSNTDIKYGANYATQITNEEVKIIMGVLPLSDWDKFTAQLKADTTYMKIIQEYNEAYKARKS